MLSMLSSTNQLRQSLLCHFSFLQSDIGVTAIVGYMLDSTLSMPAQYSWLCARQHTEHVSTVIIPRSFFYFEKVTTFFVKYLGVGA